MGKFGIILAFLLSVAAAGGSYYLYQGWVEERSVRGTVEAKYDQVKEKMITAQSEREQIRAKSEEYRTQAEAVQSDLEKVKAKQSRTDAEKAALETQLKSNQDMITELKTKMAVLEKMAKDAQAACGVTPADLKTAPISGPQSFTSGTTAGVAASPQLTFKPVVAGSSASSENLSRTAVAPALKAPAAPAAQPSQTFQTFATDAVKSGPKVLTVNRKFNFVVVNQGLQEGLKMGDKLKVFNQGKEIATVQIEKLYDKFSAATLVEENPQQQVVEGDEIRKA